MSSFLRALRLFAALSLLAPLPAQADEGGKALATGRAPPPIAAPLHARPDDPWIYRGTDIPIDRQWLFGELPNGLRYAVRNNGVPPGQVSIRVRIDAGSLYEREGERGFAHLIEHLVFRESSVFGNGEAIPHFQRLGAGLGTDTNALTYPTQTIFHIDLPNATRATLDDSLRRISGMIREPRLSTANLATEVPIVLAERRERAGPEERIVNAMNATFFAGQPLADRDAIGTVVTLQGATQDAVRAFHRRWYRPDKAVVVLVGDMPVEQLAAMVEARFGQWRAEGAPAEQPDFGKPQAPAADAGANPVGETRVLVEPGQPRNLTMGIIRPWQQVTDNLEYNRGLLIDSLAETIINRRLETRARAGGSYLQAGVQQDKPSRSANVTYVGVTPLDGDWKKALADVRAVIADAIATPPTQAEIDRELAEYDVIFANQVEQSRIQAGAKLADDLVNAVDIRESVASPETFLQVFRDMKDRFTPQAIHEHARAMFSGTVTRALLVTPQEGEATEADLRAALAAPIAAEGAGARASGMAMRFADLPPIGKAASPVESRADERFGLEMLTYGNGVKALLYPTTNEPGRVTVRVRFGAGRAAIAPDELAHAQLAEGALVASGFGEVGQEQLDRLSTGRKLGFTFRTEEGAFVFEGLTRAEDVADQLYLFAAKLATPRWEPAPFLRAKAAALLAYDSLSGSPNGILNRDFSWLLHGRDPRYATPTPAQLRAATPQAFRDVWSRLLAQGPVEVDVFGDFDRQSVTAALSRTFGALKPRKAAMPVAANDAGQGFAAGAVRTVIAHDGDADQAAGLVLWPTGAGSAGLPESRKLEVLAQVFANRLLDSMRERIGASYAPDVGSNWPIEAAKGGSIYAMAQLPPDKLDQFFAEADSIAADLATTPPGADELNRVTEPLKQTLERLVTGHTFWLNILQGAAFDGQRLAHVPSLFADYTRVTPEELRDLAARYFGGRQGWHVEIVPRSLADAQGQPSAVAAQAGAR